MSDRKVIVSNKVFCKRCGDVIFSAHRHDYKTCSCGAVGVDGGNDYLRRVGLLSDLEEMSIIMEEDIINEVIKAVEHSISTHRNARGIAYAVIRSLSDSDLLKK